MVVMVVGSGALWSTKDVERGAVEGLKAAGVDVRWYAYDQRLATSADYLQYVYRRAQKRDKTVPKPSAADVQYHALIDVLPRALAQRVDWVLVVSSIFVPKQFLEVMRLAGLRVALLLTESPYNDAEEAAQAQHADLVWTNERRSVAPLQGVQPRTYYLPHAYRASVHKPLADDDGVPAHDVVFVGTGFPERVTFLEAIDWSGLDVGLYGNWQTLQRKSPLKKFVRGGVVDNQATAALYRRARVGLNLYRASKDWQGKARLAGGEAESLNPRAYELAACGAFHLSDPRAEVVEKFGTLVPTFNSPEACSDLIRQWIGNDVERAYVRSRLPICVQPDTWTLRGWQMVQQLKAAQQELAACA